jgi:hypothetical protein
MRDGEKEGRGGNTGPTVDPRLACAFDGAVRGLQHLQV